jgi:hypothetical protein
MLNVAPNDTSKSLAVFIHQQQQIENDPSPTTTVRICIDQLSWWVSNIWQST